MNEISEKPAASPATTDSSAIMEIISRAASDPQTDVEKLERMFSLYEKHQDKIAEQGFHAAMASAQSEMGRVSADASNPQTKSKYASYAALDRALRPVYSKHGFALSFDTGDAPREDYVRVLCHVSHSAGHCRTYKTDMPADGKGAKGGDVMTKTHAAGSAMSYGMRYLLKLIFNVAVGEDDDDGNRASSTVERINEEQQAGIRALLDEIPKDQHGKFYDWLKRSMKCERIEDISVNAYKDVIRALEKKRSAA